jgi:hypothetical protein
VNFDISPETEWIRQDLKVRMLEMQKYGVYRRDIAVKHIFDGGTSIVATVVVYSRRTCVGNVGSPKLGAHVLFRLRCCSPDTAMPRIWVKEYFKHHLIESCEEYVHSHNKKGSSARTDVINSVVERITTAASEMNDIANLPDNLSKVWTTVFCLCTYVLMIPYHSP